MKKMKLFLGLAFVAVATFLVSCNPTGALQITVTPESVSAAPGETVTFDVVLTPDAINSVNLGTFTISQNLDSTIYTQDMQGASNSKTVSFDYTVPSDATLGNDIVLSFMITDPNGNNPASKVATITVGTSTPQLVDAHGMQATYTSTTLADNFMFKLGTSHVTMVNGNATDGDLAFVWQNTYGYSVVSPDCPWITELYGYNNITYSTADKKTTKIMKYTAGTWADLTAGAIDSLTVTTSTVSSANGSGNGVQGLNQGDIVVYQTADGRKGALLVKTNAKTTKYMTADLKYQGTSSAGK